MTTSMSLEERFDAFMMQNELLLKKISQDFEHNQDTKAQNEYLRKQLGAFLKQKQKNNEESLQLK